MTAHHEPRLARVAAIVADPTRSRMLAYLLSGEYATAGELATVASVTAATASGHLGKMADAGFVTCEPRGRHKYFRLADAEIAHALEAIALVAERGNHERAWASPERQRLRYARCCYGHLAGQLSITLFEALQREERLKSTAAGYELTAGGMRWLQGLGLQPASPSGRRRYAYPCLDWSERRDHLAGLLADQILAHFEDKGWLRRTSGRALAVTPSGHVELLPRLEEGARAALHSTANGLRPVGGG